MTFLPEFGADKVITHKIPYSSGGFIMISCISNFGNEKYKDLEQVYHN